MQTLLKSFRDSILATVRKARDACESESGYSDESEDSDENHERDGRKVTGPTIDNVPNARSNIVDLSDGDHEDEADQLLRRFQTNVPVPKSPKEIVDLTGEDDENSSAAIHVLNYRTAKTDENSQRSHLVGQLESAETVKDGKSPNSNCEKQVQLANPSRLSPSYKSTKKAQVLRAISTPLVPEQDHQEAVAITTSSPVPTVPSSRLQDETRSDLLLGSYNYEPGSISSAKTALLLLHLRLL
jgi:hypothetical protein